MERVLGRLGLRMDGCVGRGLLGDIDIAISFVMAAFNQKYFPNSKEMSNFHFIPLLYSDAWAHVRMVYVCCQKGANFLPHISIL